MLKYITLWAVLFATPAAAGQNCAQVYEHILKERNPAVQVEHRDETYAKIYVYTLSAKTSVRFPIPVSRIAGLDFYRFPDAPNYLTLTAFTAGGQECATVLVPTEVHNFLTGTNS